MTTETVSTVTIIKTVKSFRTNKDFLILRYIQVHCHVEHLLPTLLHVQVIKHLNEGDSDFIDVLGYHWLLQEVRRKLERGRGKAKTGSPRKLGLDG